MNIKKTIQLIYLGMILMLFVGCGTPGAVEGALTRRANNQIKEGMNRDSTLIIMGIPRETENFENLTLDRFCTTGSYDDMAEIGTHAGHFVSPARRFRQYYHNYSSRGSILDL